MKTKKIKNLLVALCSLLAIVISVVACAAPKINLNISGPISTRAGEWPRYTVVQKVEAGSTFQVSVTMENVGDEVAKEVKLSVSVPEGLNVGSINWGATGEQWVSISARSFTYTGVGDIKPNENKSFYYSINALKVGQYTITISVSGSNFEEKTGFSAPITVVEKAGGAGGSGTELYTIIIASVAAVAILGVLARYLRRYTYARRHPEGTEEASK